MKPSQAACLHAAVASALVCSSAAVRAQAAPDAGRLLQDVRPPALVAPPRTGGPDLRIPADTPARALEGQQTLVVAEFVLRGVTAIPERDVQAALRPFVGRTLNFVELSKAAQAVTALYRERGYFLARAYLPAQEVRAGRIEIAVLEGRLGRAEVSGTGARVPFRAAERILRAQLAPGAALREAELERALLLVSDLPGAAVHAEVGPGEKAGDSDLRVQLNPSPFAAGSVQISNAGSRYIGATRVDGALQLDSPLGAGDQLTANASTSGRHFNFGRIGYAVPVGSHGTRAGIAYYALGYSLCCQFRALAAEGEASSVLAFASHPLLRSRDANLTARIAIEEKRLANDALGANVSDNRLRNLPIGLALDSRDAWLGGGLWSASAEVTSGRADLARNALNEAADAASARTAGRFTKTTFQASRLQQAAEKLQLYAGLLVQRASKNLDSAERMSLGGPNGVRAYPVGEAVGDEGVLVNLEARWDFAPGWQASAFHDAGRIKPFKDLYAGALAPGVPNGYSLTGYGFGVSRAGKDFAVRLQLAFRSGGNPGRDAAGNDADGRDEDARLWISAVKYF
jgi:hemolysin activation/secretion protein